VPNHSIAISKDITMMDQLIQLAETLRFGLKLRLDDTPIRHVVQGALLEVDPYWYYWSVAQWLGSPRSAWSSGLSRLMTEASSQLLLYSGPTWNFNHRPLDWNSHCASMGYKQGGSPVVIRVVLRQPKDERSILPDSLFAGLPREYEGHTVFYEARPPVVATGILRQMADAFGVTPPDRTAKSFSVGRANPNTAGTLGGFLSCVATGRILLVSCAHVLGPANIPVYTPGPYEHKGSVPLGVVRFSTIPPLKAPGQDCNLFAMPQAGRLDVSVAEWSKSNNTRTYFEPEPSADILRSSAKMSPYQHVTFVGKESGRVNAQLTAATLWHEIDTKEFGDGFPEGSRCFGTLFEMSDFSGDRHELAQEGDSGAWVMDQVEDMRCWNGMLIGVQGRRAYGCYADFIVQALRQDDQFQQGVAMRW
jgi:hypothetical protein